MAVDVSNRKQLLLDDDFIVEEAWGVREHMHQPARHPRNPLIVADKPWDNENLGNISRVMLDEGVFRMWYTAISKTKVKNYKGKEVNSNSIGYAVSKDGIEWEKPSLGLVEWEGSKENNLIFSPLDTFGTCSVIKDLHEEDPNKRYKGFGRRKRSDDAVWHSNLWVAYSPDGLHWTYHDAPVYGDTRAYDSNNKVFWDERLGKYVAYIRRKLEGPLKVVGYYSSQEGQAKTRFKGLEKGISGSLRRIGRMESSDLINWSVPEIVLSPDKEDPPDCDLYEPAVFKYSEADNVYFLPTSLFDWRQDQAWIRLAVSRDGINWHWAGNREPFLQLGDPGSWDSEGLYMAAPPVIKDEEIYFYYAGDPLGHDRVGYYPETYPGGLGLATMRLDRFISLDAGYRPHNTGGVVTTRPITFKGSVLEVNADVLKGWQSWGGGEIKIEIGDEKGEKVFPGFTKEECDPIVGDSVRHKVSWKGKSNVKSLENRPVRLNFYMRFTRLYGFQFTEG